jgi:hypothetical protein
LMLFLFNLCLNHSIYFIIDHNVSFLVKRIIIQKKNWHSESISRWYFYLCLEFVQWPRSIHYCSIIFLKMFISIWICLFFMCHMMEYSEIIPPIVDCFSHLDCVMLSVLFASYCVHTCETLMNKWCGTK